KEMHIGTAVPSTEELTQVKHHFIQHLSIHQTYSVGHFERDAIACLDQLFKKKDVVIMVGGSGLYVDAVTKGLDNFPKIDKNIRTQLNASLKSKGLVYLQEQLKQLDLKAYQTIALDNPRRVLRALEVCIQTGQPYSSFLSENKTKRNFKPLSVALTADREIVASRIKKRVDHMMANGLPEEARILIPQKGCNALETVGYKELFTYFEGTYTLDFAISEIKKNTRRFAKRQQTWFKKNPETHWFDYQTPPEKIFDFINAITSNRLQN